MSKICYVPRRFSASSQKVIDQANTIINDYLMRGFKLTLRQLYYQFVSRGWIPNQQSEYKKLGALVNDARLAGQIDWLAIEDRGREVHVIPAWDSPADIVASCARHYKTDLWEDQNYRVEVWIEKEALLGVITPICKELRVPHFACKGYASASELWDSGHFRIANYMQRGQVPVILHLGDHDPSGVDMTRDITERVSLFVGSPITVRRIALTEEQIRQYNPPPNPVKFTDKRCEGYVAKFGESCWELDALDPDVLVALIRDNVGAYVDPQKFGAKRAMEEEHKKQLHSISKRFDDVVEFLG